jgi:catechol 2,3-dioxygenase-like lactoylglutathione lyase family enzyme
MRQPAFPTSSITCTPNDLSAALRLIVLALLLCMSGAWARPLEIQRIVITVADLDRSLAFYESALGFRKVGEDIQNDRNFDNVTGIFGTWVRSATLQLGEERIELQQYLSPAGQPLPIDSRSNDLWFQHFAVVVSDMDKAYAHLRQHPFQAISSAPQTIPASNPAAAGIRAFKFKDPDGHPLELLYFPPGKGAPKWQGMRNAGSSPFLGIDHSAIAVSDTERSLQFYRDILGLKVAGESLNSGSTQEQLDGAFGALVRVTGLRPTRDSGPGLEFLHYLTPAGGRSTPASTRPNDIAHARLVIEVDDLDRLAQELVRAHAGFISPGIVAQHDAQFPRALMVKDPDGHALLLVQR